MKLKQMIGAWMQRKAASLLTEMRHPANQNWSFLMPGTKIDYSAELGTGLEANVLMAPIMYIARVFPEARLTLRTEVKGKPKYDPSHPAARLVRAPNPFYSGTSLWWATLISWCLDGNAYWLKVKGKGPIPKELWYVPHWSIKPVFHGSEKYITHYAYTAQGKQMELDPASVIHFRCGIDPDDVRLGYGPLSPVVREAFMDSEASNLVSCLLKNRGIPGLVISPDKDVAVGPDDAKAMKDFIDDNFSKDKRGKPLVVGAATKVQQFGFSPAELDLSTIHNLAEERVCALLGIPSAIVGFGSGMEQTKVGATLEELRKLAWTDCIAPMQDMLAQDLTRSLLNDFGEGEEAELAFDRSKVGALQDNQAQQADRLDRGVRGGWITIAEARELQGLEVRPEDEIFLRPISMMEITRSGEEIIRASDQQPEEPKPGEEPKPKPKEPAEQPAKEFKRMTPLQARIKRALDRLNQRLMQKLEKRLLKFFEDFGADVEKHYVQIFKAPGDELSVEALFSSLNMEDYNQELQGIVSSHYAAVYKESNSVVSGLGLVVDAPDNVAQEILSLGGKRAGLIDLTSAGKERAFNVIESMRAEGKGPVEIARALRDEVPAGPWSTSAIRAAVIARTETKFAQSSSSLAMYENMEGCTSVMMLDNRLGPQGPRDFDMAGNLCSDINGLVTDFATAQQLLQVEHPNGTRDVVPVFGGKV